MKQGEHRKKKKEFYKIGMLEQKLMEQQRSRSHHRTQQTKDGHMRTLRNQNNRKGIIKYENSILIYSGKENTGNNSQQICNMISMKVNENLLRSRKRPLNEYISVKVSTDEFKSDF